MSFPSARRGAALLVAAALAATAIATPVTAAIEQPGNTIVVNSNGDARADDGSCSLREAIIATHDNVASGAAAGECGAGSPGAADTITFASAVSTVTLAASLPEIGASVIIDGGGDVTVSGNEGANRPFLVVPGITLTLKRLRVADVVTTSLGGALIVNGTAIVSDVTFSSTRTDAAGGGIRVNAGGTLTATRLAIEFARGNLGGGGISNAGTATLTDGWIGASAAGNTGGSAILNDVGGTFTVLRTTMNANHGSSGNGGAVTNLGTATIANSTIASNTAPGLGGGVYNAGTLSLIHVSLVGNGAETGGGVESGGGGFTTLKNTLIIGNFSDEGDPDLAGPLAGGSVGNYVGLPVGWSTNDIFNDPLWGSSSSFGPTSPPTASATNPIIDTADAATCAAAPISGKDQRGITRPAGACDIGSTELDKVAPTFSTKPTATLRSGQSLAGSASKARISWAASDNSGGSGISFHRLQWSVDGLPYAEVSIEDWDASLRYQDVELGRNHTYRFRAAARDNDGNWSAWSYGPTFLARLVQQSAASVDYTRTWTTTSNAVFSSGSVRYSKTAGASVSYRATGRAFAFVTTLGPTRGKARIYINGVLKATVDLYAATSKYRVQVWTKRYTDSEARTIKVVVLGTSGRPRVDADAFVVLK
jgi:CSLREA domain-containing protein